MTDPLTHDALLKLLDSCADRQPLAPAAPTATSFGATISTMFEEAYVDAIDQAHAEMLGDLAGPGGFDGIGALLADAALTPADASPAEPTPTVTKLIEWQPAWPSMQHLEHPGSECHEVGDWTAYLVEHLTVPPPTAMADVPPALRGPRWEQHRG